MSETEPWKDTSIWARSELAIAVARVQVAIARGLPGALGLKMEAKGLAQICNAIRWQEEEQRLWNLDPE